MFLIMPFQQTFILKGGGGAEKGRGERKAEDENTEWGGR